MSVSTCPVTAPTRLSACMVATSFATVSGSHTVSLSLVSTYSVSGCSISKPRYSACRLPALAWYAYRKPSSRQTASYGAGSADPSSMTMTSKRAQRWAARLRIAAANRSGASFRVATTIDTIGSSVTTAWRRRIAAAATDWTITRLMDTIPYSEMISQGTRSRLK
ncbi:hypothetical protein GCM10009682_25040 [Luedemannella flava]|uniref:Uncharacterized protein n=1 Tax=Luedemannella flava TaxID=349316 RepID=A0ABN2LXC8_9ACTN